MFLTYKTMNLFFKNSTHNIAREKTPYDDNTKIRNSHFLDHICWSKHNPQKIFVLKKTPNGWRFLTH